MIMNQCWQYMQHEDKYTHFAADGLWLLALNHGDLYFHCTIKGQWQYYQCARDFR